MADEQGRRRQVREATAGLRRKWALVRLLPTASPGLTAAVVCLLLLSAAIPIALMLAVGRAVSQVAIAVSAGAGSPAAHRLMVDLIVVGVLFAVGQAIEPLESPLADQLGLQARTLVFRRIMAAHLRPSSIAHLEDPDLKDLVGRVQDPGFFGTREAVAGMVAQWRIRLGGAGGVVLLTFFHWWAGLLMLVVVVHAIWRMRTAHFQMSRDIYAQTKTYRRSDYLRDLLLQPGAEKETRVFGLGPWLIERFTGEWRRATEPVWARRRRSAVQLTAGLLPVVAAVALIGSVAVHDAIAHAIGLGELAVVLPAMLIATSAATVSNTDTQVELGVGLLESVQRLEGEIELRTPVMAGARPADGLPRSEIRFDDVHFAYPGSAREIFTGLDLVVPAGRSLAIVGENGAGKTTLIKLLTRLYDPTSGRIRVDGLALDELDSRAWQQRSAAVFQDFVRYPWSVADNIALHPGADQDALVRAADRAGILDYVTSLADGWDTVLSRQLGGADLSGGQWQRIAIARALYAADAGAGILVLDEPTAHLDVRQEAAFYEQFLDLTAGLTVVVVSHRFSTVRRADHIVVVEEGRVTESGNHDELTAHGGQYARMFRLQADRFADTGVADA